MNSRRQKAPLRPSPLLLIHCGNFKKFDNRWPEEKFSELGRRLAASGTGLLWLAGPGEQEAVSAIAKAAGAGEVVSAPSLGAAGALMRRADLVVGSITGTTHLAHAVGARSFGLYAAYTDAVWRPRDARAGGIVSTEWGSCRSIGVAQVLHGIVTQLAQPGI
jgi:ADP-heptose:LPS heptosyltransferase